MVPRVSVVMSVFNGEPHLKLAIDSILGQRYSELELIVIDDGSSDNSFAIMADYSRRDSRLVPVRNDSNIGLTASLNKGLEMATGEFFARQDADDIAMPDRIALQVDYLDRHPEICLLGTAIAFIDQDGHYLGDRPILTGAENLNRSLIKGNYLTHGSIVARKRLLMQVGGYRNAFRYSQDYDLWLRLSEICELDNLEQVLYWRRITPSGISAVRSSQQAKFRSLAQKLAKERRDYGQELTSVNTVSLEIVTEEPSLGREVSMGYLGYARDMFSVWRYWSGSYYFVLSVLACPFNLEPWRWLLGLPNRRINKLY